MNTITIPSGCNIDPVLRANREPTRFVLEPGHYVSNGSPAFADLDYCMLAPGCELIGAGSHLTDIWFDDDGVPANAAQFECLTAGSRSGDCERVRIEGVLIDADSIESPRIGRVGLHCWSDVAIIRDVEVVGITGYRPDPGQPATPSREGFGVLINQSNEPGPENGAHRIENVVVRTLRRSGPEHYVCGFYVGVADPLRYAVATDIEVINLSGATAHAAFGINGHVLGSRWRNHGRWNRAVFCDVCGGAGTSISDSQFAVERVGVELRGTYLDWRDIEVRDSRFVFTAAPDATYVAGLVLADDGGTTFDNVRLVDCALRAGVPDGRKLDRYPGSANGIRTSGCGLFRCEFHGADWAKAVVTDKVPAGGFKA